jgi:haloalkane dehalogenase
MSRTFQLALLATVVVTGGCGSSGSEPAAATTSTQPTTTTSAAPACPPPELPPGTPLGDAELRWTAECVPYVRTPESSFAAVDLPYEPRYVDVEGLRMAYVEAGSADGEVVLLLHGQPTWSYLYRDMIRVLAEAGHRVIAPDLIGMGRSDKPVQLGDYSYLRHVAWVSELIHALDLRDITVFVQDWGSLIGLRVVGDHPERFARVVVANGRLPVLPEGIQPVTFPDPPIPDDDLTLPFGPGEAVVRDVPHLPFIAEEFARWAVYALIGTQFRPSEVVDVLSERAHRPEELAAFDAPFPERIYMAGPRVFPSLINTIGEAPTNQAAREVFDAWTKPLLTIFGRLDRTLGSDAIQAEMRDRAPGAAGQPHHAYPDANHFIQEDKGPDLARRVDAFIRDNPLPGTTSTSSPE